MYVEGTVVAFDGHRGWGEVEDGEGRRYPFHCTSIADGSRMIAPGTLVLFSLAAGHLGRWEAVALRPRT